jgi:hypothetical protein
VEARHPAYRLTSHRWHAASLPAQSPIAIGFNDDSVAE